MLFKVPASSVSAYLLMLNPQAGAFFLQNRSQTGGSCSRLRPSRVLSWCRCYSHFSSPNAELYFYMKFKAILWISHALHSTIIWKLWKPMCDNGGGGGGEVLVQIVIWRKQQQLQHRLPCQTLHARVWINYTIIGQNLWMLHNAANC